MNEYSANIRPYKPLPTDRQRVREYEREVNRDPILQGNDRMMVSGTRFSFYRFCTIILFVALLVMIYFGGSKFLDSVENGRFKDVIDQTITSYFNQTTNNQFNNEFNNEAKIYLNATVVIQNINVNSS